MTRSFRAVALLAIGTALGLGGCVMPDKGVTGVFPPESIAAPPSIRGDAATPETAPKTMVATEARASRGLSVPRPAP